MCIDPVTAGFLTFAVGAAQTAATYAAGVQESAAVQEAATASYEQDQSAISLRQIQEADAASQKLRLQSLDEAKLVSEAEVSAAAANVSGISVENIVGDVRRQAANNRTTIRENLRGTVNQLQLERKGSQARNQSRINAAPKPSPLSLVASLAGDALSGYNAYNKQIAL